MSDRGIWLLGIGLCLAWLALGSTLDGWMKTAGFAAELRPYVQGVLPALAAFFVTCFGGPTGWLKASALIIVIAIAGTLANFVAGELGQPTDFPGINGIPIHFTMVVVIATEMITPGVVVGWVARYVLPRRPRV